MPVGRFRARRALVRLQQGGLVLCAMGCFSACRQAPPPSEQPREQQGSAATGAAQHPPAAADGGSSTAADAARELSWRFAEGPFGPTEVVVSVPAAASPGARFPVLVAFHGREQTVRESQQGARAWLDDYRLGRARERLTRPPLVASDFESLVSEERLAQINAALQAQPYAGMIVVCPFLPDVLAGEHAFREGRSLADFLVERVLPRVRARTPALQEPAATGLDGISLGGRAALLVGLSRPLDFGSVGALQPALGPGEVERFAELGAAALRQNPGLRLRLVTSDEDPFAQAIRALSAALSGRGAPHALTFARGAHGPAFTRGPGAIEMLLFHSRALRGLPAP